MPTRSSLPGRRHRWFETHSFLICNYCRLHATPIPHCPQHVHQYHPNHTLALFALALLYSVSVHISPDSCLTYIYIHTHMARVGLEFCSLSFSSSAPTRSFLHAHYFVVVARMVLRIVTPDTLFALICYIFTCATPWKSLRAPVSVLVSASVSVSLCLSVGVILL